MSQFFILSISLLLLYCGQRAHILYIQVPLHNCEFYSTNIENADIYYLEVISTVLYKISQTKYVVC